MSALYVCLFSGGHCLPADHGCESPAAVRSLAFGLVGFFAKDWSMQIPLGHGRFAEIDEDVFCLVQQYKWRLLGGPNARWHYAAATTNNNGKRSVVLMHRLIAGAGAGSVVDHADGDGLNNRRSNIRVCTHAENMRNRSVASSNALGILNVYAETRLNRSTLYVVQVVTNGERVRRRFKSMDDAIRAAQRMRAEAHGEFATHQFRTTRFS